MKYFLWAGTLVVLALFGFTLAGFLNARHESLQEQVTRSPELPVATPMSTPWGAPQTPESRALAADDPEPVEGPTPPPPTFDDPKKQAALEELVRTRAQMQALRPPQITSSDPAQVGAGINAYVNQMGQRAQAYNQARAALQEHLSKQEAARLSQILAQP